jgi:hypothetical protein
MVVGKQVNLSLRLTMHHDGKIYVGSDVVLHNISLGNWLTGVITFMF